MILDLKSATRKDIEIIQGGSYSFSLPAKDRDGNSVALSGCTGTFAVKRFAHDKEPYVEVPVAVSGSGDDQVDVSLSSSDTDIDSGVYFYTIRFVNDNNPDDVFYTHYGDVAIVASAH